VFCERTYFALGGIVLTHFEIVAPLRKDYVQLHPQYTESQIRFFAKTFRFRLTNVRSQFNQERTLS